MKRTDGSINMQHNISKENVSVIHDDDLHDFLESIGILQQFNQGEVKCKFCKEPVTFDNLHSIFPQSGVVKTVCDKTSCIRELSNLLRKGTINL